MTNINVLLAVNHVHHKGRKDIVYNKQSIYNHSGYLSGSVLVIRFRLVHEDGVDAVVESVFSAQRRRVPKFTGRPKGSNLLVIGTKEKDVPFLTSTDRYVNIKAIHCPSD